MIWHLRAMWDAAFDMPVWASFLGFGAAAAFLFWLGGGWVAAGIVCAINAIWLPIYAWWLAYGLICKYRPIGEHYGKIETPYATYTYSDYDR